MSLIQKSLLHDALLVLFGAALAPLIHKIVVTWNRFFLIIAPAIIVWYAIDSWQCIKVLRGILPSESDVYSFYVFIDILTIGYLANAVFNKPIINRALKISALLIGLFFILSTIRDMKPELFEMTTTLYYASGLFMDAILLIQIVLVEVTTNKGIWKEILKRALK